MCSLPLIIDRTNAVYTDNKFSHRKGKQTHKGQEADLGLVLLSQVVIIFHGLESSTLRT